MERSASRAAGPVSFKGRGGSRVVVLGIKVPTFGTCACSCRSKDRHCDRLVVELPCFCFVLFGLKDCAKLDAVDVDLNVCCTKTDRNSCQLTTCKNVRRMPSSDACDNNHVITLLGHVHLVASGRRDHKAMVKKKNFILSL